MAKYTSIHDVVEGHINALIEANSLDKKDYPFQNDINSSIIQLAAIYAEISGEEVSVAADAFSIAGALDALLDVVDAIVSPSATPNPSPTNDDPNEDPEG